MTSTQPREAGQPSPPQSSLTAPHRVAVGRVITAALVIGPFAALGVAIPLLWGHFVHLRDIILGIALYVVTGHAVTTGFHRLFSHRSFKASRRLKVALAVLGSMAIEGSIIGWVANHRRHHMFSDRPGDPHSPRWRDAHELASFRGFMHAHLGWLFRSEHSPAERFAPDLLADSDIVLVSRLFPLLAIFSLLLPFLVGWGWSGTIMGGLTALLWAGLVRMALLHHVTWSVNSVCHLYGRQPYKTTDNSRNFAPLALLSFGDSWHNLHHAYPSSARHGVRAHQVDSTALLIRLFELAGSATNVRWPTADRLAACRAN